MPLNRREFVIGTLAAAGCGCLTSCTGRLAPPIPAGPVDVGTMADYPKVGAVGRWAETHGFYVVREKNRLFAVSSTCTHKKCLVEPEKEKGADQFVCGCHGSRFSEAGSLLKGPARVSLPHLSIALGPAGRIIVNAARQFDEKQWDEPGAFITVS